MPGKHTTTECPICKMETRKDNLKRHMARMHTAPSVPLIHGLIWNHPDGGYGGFIECGCNEPECWRYAEKVPQFIQENYVYTLEAVE